MNTYQYLVEDLSNGTYYFRLKLINEDESFSYSPIVSVKLSSKEAEIILSPNPATDHLLIDLGKLDLKNMPTKAVVYTVEGRLIEDFILSESKLQLDISNWLSGIYVLSISTDSGFDNRRIIKK